MANLRPLASDDKFQLETLQEAGFLLEDLQREIARRTGRMQREIAAAMEDAGVRTLAYDDRLYRQAGHFPTPLVQSPYLIALMERGYRATAGEWTNFTRTTAEAAQQTFVRACDKAYHLAMSGAISPTQAVREALNDVIRDGICVEYPTGHRDTMETATARAVRTGISQASAQIQLARMDEFGVELVLVSSHLGARPAHQVWQGKVYARSGKHPDYPDFVQSTGYGRVDGLCGANCRHHISPFFEGQHNPFTQYDSEENQKQYATEQRQRAMERRIRDTKRQTMNWKTAMDKETDPAKQAEFAAEYRRKAALLKKQHEAYRAYCAANGQKTRPERLEIARWNRSQAAKAAAAAKQTPEKTMLQTPSQDAILTEDDEQFLYRYKSAEGYFINAALRGEMLLPEEYEPVIDGIDRALSKLPEYKGTVYRSLRSEDMLDPAAFWAEHTEGNFVQYSAYTSASTELYDESMDIQLVIECQRGRDMRKFNPLEQEILFKRGSRFLVERVEGNTIWLTED